jgi:hypothetical protein
MAQTHQGDFIITKNLTVGTEGGVIDGDILHSVSGAPGTVQYEVEILKGNSNFGDIVENFSELPSTGVSNKDLYFVRNRIDLPVLGAAAGNAYTSQGLNPSTLLYISCETKSLSNVITDSSANQREFYTVSPLSSDFIKFGGAYIDFQVIETGGSNENGKLIEKTASGDFKDLQKGTISMWIRPDHLPSDRNEDYIICGFSKNEFYIRWDKVTNSMVVHSRQGALLNPINSGNSFRPIPLDAANSWHNILFTWDENKWVMYFDANNWGEWEVSGVATYAASPTKKFSVGNIFLNAIDTEGIDFPVDEIFIESKYLFPHDVLSYYSDGVVGGVKKSGWYRYENGNWIHFQAVDPHVVTAENVLYDDSTVKDKLDSLILGEVGILKGYVRDYNELPSNASNGSVYLVGKANDPTDVARGSWTVRSGVFSQMEAIVELDPNNNYQLVENSSIEININPNDIAFAGDITTSFIGFGDVTGDIIHHPISDSVDYIGNKDQGTVMFWIRSNETPGDNAIFNFSYPNTVTYGREFQFSLIIEESGFDEHKFKLLVGRKSNSIPVTIPNTNSPVLSALNFFNDSYHHVAVSWDTTEWRIYLDGEVYDSFANSDGLVPLAVNSSLSEVNDQPDLIFNYTQAGNEFKEIIVTTEEHTQAYIQDYIDFSPISVIKSSGFYRKDVSGYVKLEVEDPFGILENININLIPTNTGLTVGSEDFRFESGFFDNLDSNSITTQDITTSSINVEQIMTTLPPSASQIGSVLAPYGETHTQMLFANNIVLGGEDLTEIINNIETNQSDVSEQLLALINTNIQDISGLQNLLDSIDVRVSANENAISANEAAILNNANDIQNLETTVASLSSNVQTHSDRISSLELRSDALEITDNNHEGRITWLETNIDAVSAVPGTVEILESDINALSIRIDSNDSDISTLTTTATSLSESVTTNALNISNATIKNTQQDIEIAALQADIEALTLTGVPSGGATISYVDDSDALLQQQIDNLETTVNNLSGQSGSTDPNQDILGHAPQGPYVGPSNIEPTDLDNEAIYKLDQTLSYLLPPAPEDFPNSIDIQISGIERTAFLALDANVPGIGPNGTSQSWYDDPTITFNGTELGKADKGRYILEVFTDGVSGFVIEDEINLIGNFNEAERSSPSGQSNDPLNGIPLGILVADNREWYSSNPGVIAPFPAYQVADLTMTINKTNGLFANEVPNAVRIRHDVDLNLASAFTTNSLQFKFWETYNTGEVVTINSFDGSFDSPPNVKYLSGVRYFTDTATFSVSAEMQDYSNMVYQNNMLSLSSFTGFSGATLTRTEFGLTTPSPSGEIATMSESFTLNPSTHHTGSVSTTLTPLAYTGNGTPEVLNLGSIVVDSYSSSNDTSTVRNFRDEEYRLISGTYDVYGDIATGTWDSTQSISGAASAGYENALQIYNNQLVARQVDFTQYLPHGLGSVVNPDFTGNFSSGDAYYTWFEDAIGHSGGTFTVNGVTGAEMGTKYKIYMKMPGVTSWLDMNASYSGSGPASSSGPLLNVVSNTITWTLGTLNTASSNNALVIRIELLDSSAAFNSFSITWF